MSVAGAMPSSSAHSAAAPTAAAAAAAVSAPPRRQRVDGLRTWPARYGLALLLVAASLGITMALEQMVRNAISPLFFLAIMFSAWYGGLGPALLATGLATFACAYFFLDPKDSLLIGFDDVMRLAVFTVTAVLTSSLTALRRRAETALQQAHDELDSRVRERTAELRAVNESLHQQIDHARRVEVALRQAEERFRLVIEGVTDYAIFMLDPDGRVVSWNPGAARISGWSEEEIAGRHYECFFPPDDGRRTADAARGGLTAAAAGGRLAAEGWRVRKDRSLFWAEETVTALRGEDTTGGGAGGTGGALRGFAVIMRDVTERKRLEQSVLEVSERERRRIGHDLHDGLGQQLTGLALRSKMLEHNLASTSPADAAEARRVAELINQTIRHARDLAHGLAPVDQDAEGLCGALRQLAVQAQELFGVRCRVEADDDRSGTSPLADDGDEAAAADAAAGAHVYRIVQEAINNAVKHGAAREVVIRLSGGGGHGVLSVSDDGAGFDPARAPRGMGLDLMSYRARMIGGALEVTSRPGQTVITCTWSRPRAASAATTLAEREGEQHA